MHYAPAKCAKYMLIHNNGNDMNDFVFPHS